MMKPSVKRGARKVSESGEDLCPICDEVITVFAIGHCDHVICHRCSTRMRALCNQMYCPICRTDLGKVYFSPVLRPYANCNQKKAVMIQAHGVLCEDKNCEAAYRKLLEQQCPHCERNDFRDFRALRAHVRKDHVMFYCDICVDNLKTFTFERKTYSRPDLARHRRIGDVDDTSHKGHPMCEFCDERYLDNDELLRHLRKEHYYCHICDTGGAHQYYSDYDLLLVHFKDYHFVCEEDDCHGTQFTNVFKTVIDLKAHRAQAHSAGKKRSVSKQERVLDVPIGLPARRPVGREERDPGRGRRDHRRDRDRDREEENSTPPAPPVVQKQPDLKDEEDFPSISGGSSLNDYTSSVNDTMAKRFASTVGHNVGQVDEDDEQYPALPVNPNRPPPDPVPLRPKAKPATKSKVRQFESIDEEFPALSGGSGPNIMRIETNSASAPSFSSISGMIAPAPTPNVTTIRPVEAPKVHQPAARFDVEDFPSLGGSTGTQPATWVTAKTKAANKSAEKGKKVAAMPDLSSIADSINESSVQTKPIDQEKNQKPATKPEKSTKESSSAASTNPAPAPAKPQPKKGGKESLVTDYLADIAQDIGSITLDQGDSSDAAKNKNKKTKKKKKKKGKSNEENENENNQNTKQGSKAMEEPEISDEEPSSPMDLAPPEKQKSFANPPEGRDSPKTTSEPNRPLGQHNGWTVVSNNNNNSVKPKFVKDDFPSLSSVSKPPPPQYREPPSLGNIVKTTKPAPVSKNDDDFPSLSSIVNSTYTPVPAPKPQKKSGKKPPGLGADDFPPLENDVMTSPPPPCAPPGFRAMVADAPPVNLEPEYVLPRQYKERNGKLMHRIRQLLGHSDARFETFKIISGTYRLNDIGAEEYYHQCKNLVGDKFVDVFPELLVLLPDIAKQNELYGAHLIDISRNLKNDIGASELLGCSTCRQIVRANELKEHSASHGPLAAMGGRRA